MARQRTAPPSPTTVGWLAHAELLDDALDAFRRGVEEHPEQMAEAFQQFGFDLGHDQSRDHRPKAREILAAARARLPELSRDEQATAALAMMTLEGRVAPPSVNASAEHRDRLRAFVATYDGTHAANMARVQLAQGERLSTASLAAWDGIVTAQPGTEMAAQALYDKGFNLSRNAFFFGFHPFGDPTDRFLQVIAIVGALESGQYPPSRAVAQASSLVTGFGLVPVAMPDAAPVPRDNAARVVDAIVSFTKAHFHLADHPWKADSLLYLLSRGLPAMALRAGGPQALERAWKAVEQAAPDPAIVRVAQAPAHSRGRRSPGSRSLSSKTDR